MLERIKQFFTGKRTENNPDINEKINEIFSSLDTDILRVEIGNDLVPFGEKICSIVGDIRSEIKEELGFIIPAVHIINNELLQENEYTISIRGSIFHDEFVIPNEKGITDDIYGSLKDIILTNFKKIMTNELTEKYIEKVRTSNPLLIWDITGAISTSEIRTILSELLENGKSIRNISEIFEKISEQIYIENTANSRNPHKIATEISKEI